MANRSFADELLALEKRYWTAIKKKDAADAMRLSYDPCIVTGPQGVSELDHKSLSKMLQEAPWTLESFELEDVNVKRIGDEVAIVAYHVRESLTVDGKPVELEAADASTWIFSNGAWRCALHSEAIRGDAFGRH
jgi:ketosteroid isomerase-like protein